MNTRILLAGLFKDDDTYKVLDITHYFLGHYFGYPSEQAGAMMVLFFRHFGSRFDENVVHHESAYRLAAIIHYLVHLKDDPDKLGDWMLKSGRNQPPPEALEYFRDHYFN